MIHPHQHMEVVYKTEWYPSYSSTGYRWICPYCLAEGLNMVKWVEPEGVYFGVPLIDHIMSCDEVVEGE